MHLCQRVVKNSLFVLVISTLILAGHARPVAADSLYGNYHNDANIKAVVDQFLDSLVTDIRISHLFSKYSVARLREELLEQFCVEQEGPCQMSANPLQHQRALLQVNSAEFFLVKQHLAQVLQNHHVSGLEQNRLLQVLVENSEPVADVPLASL